MNSQSYKKYNSFNEFRQKIDEKKIFHRTKNIITNFLKINEDNEKYKIIKQIYEDLYGDISSNNKNEQKFSLHQNTVKEIDSMSDDDLIKYLYHRYRYDIFPQKKIIDDYPPCLQIEPTSICNYRCVFCYQTDEKLSNKKSGNMGNMSFELYKSIIDQVQGNVEFITLASRGEPLINKDIIKMLDYSGGKFCGFKINTNASMLNENISHAILRNNVQTLVFSADAADEVTYSKYRVNGKLKKVMQNIKLFNDIKKKFYPNSKIITRVSGVKVSQSQNIDEMEKVWKDLVDQVVFVNYIPWENVYLSKDNNLETSCSDLWRRMFVWWDGKANPCDVDYLSNLSPGNCKETNISNIWLSAKYQNLRTEHQLKNRSKINPCSKCSLV